MGTRLDVELRRVVTLFMLLKSPNENECGGIVARFGVLRARTWHDYRGLVTVRGYSAQIRTGHWVREERVLADHH